MSTKLSKIVADFSTTLTTKLPVGGTTASILDTTDDDGVSLPTGNYYFTIDGNNSSKEHIYAAYNAGNLTSIKSISRQGAETSGAVREHRVGATISITDFAHILRLNQLLTGETDLDSSDPLKYDGTASITDNNHLATKKYADDLAIAGAPNASETVKGIVELATGAETAAGTSAGATGARLVPANSNFKNSSAGAGDANKVPVLNANGSLAASFGGTASSLATLNGSSKVVEDPANATVTPTASKIPIADGSGKLANGWLNNTEISTKSMTAGETINGATLPVAVYQSTATNKFYACDGNDATKVDFIGFAISNSTDANPITIQFKGIVSGFTGLSEGTRYYVQDDKTIGTTPGTYQILVGIAISETELWIRNSDIISFNNGIATYALATASGTQTIAHGLGRIPKKVKLTGIANNAAITTRSYGVYNGTNQMVAWDIQSGSTASYTNSDTNKIIDLGLDVAHSNYQGGVISMDATNLTITWTKVGTPASVTAIILWEVEG